MPDNQTSDLAQAIQDASERASLLVREADRTGRLVSDLLAVARLDAGEMARPRESTDLAALVDQELDRVRLTHPSVQLSCEGKGTTASVDRQQVAGIIRNLVDNAVRHAHSGVALERAAAGDRVLISVVDDGPGIGAEDRERVFDRFTRLDQARDRDAGGSGLGLAIVRETVQVQGGEITVGERPGGGAVFRITLPRDAEPASPPVHAS